MPRLLLIIILLPLAGFAIVNRQSSIVNWFQLSIDERFNRAADLQRRGALKEAETEYRALLALAPGYAEAHANLGAVLMRLDRYEEAIASYETALRLNPGLEPVRLNLAIAHYRKGEFEKALAAFKRFLEKAPGHLQAIQLTGLSLLELGRDPEAIEFLSQAESQAPGDAAVLYGLGLAYLRLKKPELPATLERLRKVRGGEAPMYLLLGQSHLERSEFEPAVTELEKAARINPDLPRLHYSLGLAYMRLRRTREALAEFETELRRTPNDSSTLYYTAYLQEAEGDLAAARSSLERALSIEPASIEATALLEKVQAREAMMAAGKQNKFVGARSCVPCHKDQADKQLASNMARAAFSPKEHPLFDRFKNEAARLSGFRFLFLWERDQFEISVSDGTRELRIPAQWALGAGVHGVTFISRLEKGKYLEYLLSFYSHAGRLDFTPGQGDRQFWTLTEAAGQPNSRDEAFRCLSCHTTGSVDSTDADDIRVGELGVHCEACHGPGLLHLEAVKREDWEEARRQIQNPKRSTAREVLVLCGSCHREPPADPKQVNWKDPANARFQPIGLSQSRCFLRSGGKLSCLTCHDSHSDVRRAEPKFYSDICARCHNATKSPPAAGCSASDCVGCHMPRVQAISHMEFSNHWIGIYSSSNRLVPVH